jgi:hypothetical protein
MFTMSEMGDKFVDDLDGVIIRIVLFEELIEHPVNNFAKFGGLGWEKDGDLMKVAGQ